MKLHLGIGSRMKNDNETPQAPKGGWATLWESLAAIVFILACFAYCSRQEIVQIINGPEAPATETEAETDR